jgi:hypothetical protein
LVSWNSKGTILYKLKAMDGKITSTERLVICVVEAIETSTDNLFTEAVVREHMLMLCDSTRMRVILGVGALKLPVKLDGYRSDMRYHFDVHRAEICDRLDGKTPVVKQMHIDAFSAKLTIRTYFVPQDVNDTYLLPEKEIDNLVHEISEKMHGWMQMALGGAAKDYKCLEWTVGFEQEIGKETSSSH